MKSFNEWLKVRNLNETPAVEEPEIETKPKIAPKAPVQPNTPAHPWAPPKKNPDVEEDPQDKKKSK